MIAYYSGETHVRRADRLFDIIQALRVATRPLTAADLASQLEVAPRTIYRDIATLQARRIPIEGAAGIGYVLRRGYDLPPLTFTEEEIEAIALGVRLLSRLQDEGLRSAGETVLSKLATAMPASVRPSLATPRIWISAGDAIKPTGVDLAEVRGAIRNALKLHIIYRDEEGRRSTRRIRPIAMVYYVDVTLVAAWCELRKDYRHFRVDRIAVGTVLDEGFADAASLMSGWLALRRTAPHFSNAPRSPHLS